MSNDEVIRAGTYKIGTKQTMKTVEQGKAVEVFVAKDADPKITNKVTQLCRKHGIKVTYVDTMKMLGKACGIEVGAATAALLK
ncbi:ribosomal L7Ae/L30e/S12e/Gadd45 family protein [Marinicrinis lubricantis]|uniref:Ribosomal L7Ae/L30e/S12e/Gadd45 family protein n=1 Tax=Marinicrinis lubricantis TaxID=2086470 RepID=A0ABW1IS33_9BACL